MTVPPDPTQWRQFLLIDKQSICYLYHKPGEESLTGEIDVTGVDEDGRLKAVENTVYNNPFLLDDYAATTIVVRAEAFSLLPNDYAEHPEAAVKAHKASRVATDNDITVATHGSLTAVWEMEQGLNNFLQRTYNSPVTLLHLQPLVSHFTAMSRMAIGTRLYLNFHGKDTLDIVVTDERSTLQLANTVNLRDTSDAAYFALNAWHQTARDDEAQILLTGDNDMRTAVAPLLKRYVANVKQAIAPAALIALGEAAVAMPLELTACALDLTHTTP